MGIFVVAGLHRKMLWAQWLSVQGGVFGGGVAGSGSRIRELLLFFFFFFLCGHFAPPPSGGNAVGNAVRALAFGFSTISSVPKTTQCFPCYMSVPLYLWWIQPILKSCKVPRCKVINSSQNGKLLMKYICLKINFDKEKSKCFINHFLVQVQENTNLK